ncbi:D-ribose pyranase [Bittarella massiliensis (ex Durand et al. 2017)]|uniref:D-ribose pyranase n=1 Tax=Bittarella massiliensis (ex Durand et al. 2017) TaxID=1720313 RepID=UPI001AA1163A|nr:D-ribose pyranase [Bittarella massiliensis (ex Durand et al. 2017)]MBO1679898.1 D-ribose pyranase [Bittarella massiliensis (ex Durand et al. 2017)]
MKKKGILNAQLAGYIAGLAHKECFMITDAGMPIPKGVPVVDLAVCGGVPTFRQVMDAIMGEVAVEHYTVAKEIGEHNPVIWSYIQEKLPGTSHEMIDHVDLKEMSGQIKFAVRTGEFTPYPNVILQAAVVY